MTGRVDEIEQKRAWCAADCEGEEAERMKSRDSVDQNEEKTKILNTKFKIRSNANEKNKRQLIGDEKTHTQKQHIL